MGCVGSRLPLPSPPDHSLVLADRGARASISTAQRVLISYNETLSQAVNKCLQALCL